MTIKDYQDGKLILLSKPFDNRSKILNIIYFAVFSLAGLIMLTISITTDLDSFGITVLTLSVVCIYLIVGYRFINKALMTEKLFINKKDLTILKNGFLSQKSNSYDIGLISNFRHLEKPTTTKHPLAGQSFDYLGFQTEQQVINEMHGDDRLAFDYKGRTIKFGENIYSWDFDYLEVLLYEITGKDFQNTNEIESD